MIESETTEFKREYVDDIKKTVIAFANGNGGNLYIGITNDGAICGVADVDDCQLRVVSSLRDSIMPDVTMFTNITVETSEGKQIVRVEVQHGTSFPYYLTSKGIRPEGVFVRKGACTIPATSAEILRMIKDAAGDSFEAERSLNQQLTFDTANKFFSDRKVAFGEEQKRTLGIISNDGTYSNLGLLLSDQCTHTIKLAAFEGTAKTIFKDRKEYSGSLFRQLEETYDALMVFNHLRADFEGLNRIDYYDYPLEAVREALLNAIVHREYGFSASTLISVFDDRIEFTTIGGLPKGITESDIMLGISIPRNSKLAEVFYRLRLIEAYGTGMLKIKECYRESSVQPSIEITDNAFKITLPNLNANAPLKSVGLSEKEKQIISYIKGNGVITRTDVQRITGCSQTTAVNTLNSLIGKGMVSKRRNGVQIEYYLN